MGDTSFSVSQFYSNDLPSEHTPSSSNDHIAAKRIKEDQIETFFDISATSKWILENNYKRVALQFPDQFVKYSTFVSESLTFQTGVKCFILADTSYRSCCVDEVAAAHASCDCLVHYGDTCLSASSGSVAVRFVLGRLPVKHSRFSSKILFEQRPDSPIILLSDAPYSYALEEFATLLRLETSQPVYPAIVDFFESTKKNRVRVLGRQLDREAVNVDTATLFFIGDPESQLLSIWLMTFPFCDKVVVYNPEDESTETVVSSAVRQLRKRLFLIEKLRDSSTVGLIVGSVSVAGHREAVKRMRTLCSTAGKKMHVISIGKLFAWHGTCRTMSYRGEFTSLSARKLKLKTPEKLKFKVNVPKLSNFSSDIDVFILLSCPFGICLDNSAFYRPVMSLFEAEVALNPEMKWAAGSGWSADFSTFIHNSIGRSEKDDTDVSLITGKVRTTHSAAKNANLDDRIALYSAGDHFKLRSWKGLDDSVKEGGQDVTIGEGRSGIAAAYRTESSK